MPQRRRRGLRSALIGYLAAILALGNVAPAAAAIYPTDPNTPAVVNVFGYLTSEQQSAVLNRTGAVDVTAAISNAVAKANALGNAKLYFPDGLYPSATCNFTLTGNVLLMGDGMGALNSTGGGSEVDCSHNTNSVFILQGLQSRVEGMHIKDTAAARTAGSAILANGTNENQQLNIAWNLLDGFKITLNLSTSNSSGVIENTIQNCLQYCIQTQNTVNTDAGDWDISFNKMYPAQGAQAALNWLSGGDGKIVGNAVVPNSTSIIDGFDMDTTGRPSIQMFVAFNKIERVTGTPLNITNGYSPFVIIGNIFNTVSVTAPAIALGPMQQGYVAGNVLQGNGGALAITLNGSVPSTTFGVDTWSGFTAHLTSSIDATSRDISYSKIGNATITLGNPTATTTIQNMTELDSNLFAANDSATGKPVFVLSSTGSNYGQIDHVTGDKWCLGYGTTKTANGTCMLDWGTAGVDLPQITTDATHTTRTICQDTTSKVLYFGSGTAGICLGTSSLRYKQDVASLEPGLSAIMGLKPISYRYKVGYGDDGVRRQFGFAAEDVVKVLPTLVDLDVQGRPNAVDLMGVLPVLVKAVQEQQAEIDALKAQIANDNEAHALRALAARR